MGRIKGGKNKVKKADNRSDETKKRGRPPKKVYAKPVEIDPEFAPINTKTYKFLGYCPKSGCESMVGSIDVVSKNKFKCTVCGKEGKLSELKETRKPKGDVPKTKREFLHARNVNVRYDNEYVSSRSVKDDSDDIKEIKAVEKLKKEVDDIPDIEEPDEPIDIPDTEE